MKKVLKAIVCILAAIAVFIVVRAAIIIIF